jgi:hypothetical protein
LFRDGYLKIMIRNTGINKTLGFGIVAFMAVAAVQVIGWAATPEQGGAGFCLGCHGNKEEMLNELIYVNPEVFSSSIHGTLGCTDCHQDAGGKGTAEGLRSSHPARLQPVNCTACHFRGNLEGAPDFTPMQQYKTSVHGRASLERGDTDVPTCSDCHGKHNIRPASDPESTIFRANIPRTCAVCHENMQMILKHNIHVEQPYSEYQQSVHGKASLKDGEVRIAAVCTDCHGVHDIQANGEVDLKPHLPSTCGRCHLEEYLAYTNSIHGRDFKRRISDVPVCADCHGEHNIAAPWNPESSVSAFNITNTCARCHDDVARMSKYNIVTNKVSTYRQSDHGMGSKLGIVSVATCVSCHGHHEILPAYDPESSINQLNLRKTCGMPSCHPEMPPEILQSKIHIDQGNQDIAKLKKMRSIVLWSIGVLMCLGIVTGFLVAIARGSDQNKASVGSRDDD